MARSDHRMGLRKYKKHTCRDQQCVLQRGRMIETTYPRTVIPHSVAFFATSFARSSPCCTVQLILALLKPSVALTNTATSLAPCSIAISSPFTFGTRTGSRRSGVPCSCLMDSFPSTSRPSANCGIAFGETTDVNSIVRSPVARSRWINSSFTEVGTGSLIFCRPSRGPTSTMRTALDIVIVPVYSCAALRSETSIQDAARRSISTTSMLSSLSTKSVGMGQVISIPGQSPLSVISRVLSSSESGRPDRGKSQVRKRKTQRL